MTHIPTDESLLERMSRGDETAFLLLYQRHRDTTFRFAYRMLGSVELAEDVTHDCFLSLIRRPERFDSSRASLRTYLYSAVRNLVLKRFRKTGNETSVEHLPEAFAPSDSGGPLRRLLDEELALEVQRAISALPPLQREALVLFEYEQQTLAEIAEIAGADVGTVKSRLHRARARLRKELAPYFKSYAAVAAVE